jgi:hypothetical protein
MIRKTGLTAAALALCCAAAPALAGELTLETRSEPKHAQDFTYAIVSKEIARPQDPPVRAQSARLDDDTGAAGADNEFANVTKLTVPGGLVEIYETPVPRGWKVMRINCVGPDRSPKVDLALARVVVANPTWCIFTHQKVAP